MFCESGTAAHSTFGFLNGLSLRPPRWLNRCFACHMAVQPVFGSANACGAQLAAHVVDLQPCNLLICQPPAGTYAGYQQPWETCC